MPNPLATPKTTASPPVDGALAIALAHARDDRNGKAVRAECLAIAREIEALSSPPSDETAKLREAMERFERRATWMREAHKLDVRQFVDRDGRWSTFDFVNDAVRLIAALKDTAS